MMEKGKERGAGKVEKEEEGRAMFPAAISSSSSSVPSSSSSFPFPPAAEAPRMAGGKRKEEEQEMGRKENPCYKESKEGRRRPGIRQYIKNSFSFELANLVLCLAMGGEGILHCIARTETTKPGIS